MKIAVARRRWINATVSRAFYADDMFYGGTGYGRDKIIASQLTSAAARLVYRGYISRGRDILSVMRWLPITLIHIVIVDFFPCVLLLIRQIFRAIINNFLLLYFMAFLS